MDTRTCFVALLLAAVLFASGCVSPATTGADLASPPEQAAPAPTYAPSGDPACVALGCPTGTRLVGSAKSDKYHDCDCYWAKQIYRSNLVCFRDAVEARSKGYVPCKVCGSRDYGP